ncbi:MAG: helix-turn-helix transcriptional regulator [Clostridia bacterium]|nr:helix-turn-helix transcriptional regulator [Clostridia bacterium]
METRIKELREDNDLTQREVSKILNVSQVAYSYYEISKRSIPLELLCKLADYYNTSTDYLLFRTNEVKPYKKAKIKIEEKELA